MQGAPGNVAIRVDTKTNILEVREGEKLVAAYPVTVGSAHTTSPIGEWKVRGIAKMPSGEGACRLFSFTGASPLSG